MAEQAKMKLESLRRSAEEKLGVTRDKFDAAVMVKRNSIKAKKPDISEAELEQRVYILVKSELKKQLLSPAQHFEGVIIASGRTFDQIAELRAEAFAMAKKDEAAAIADGWIDTEGHPLDRRQTYGTGTVNRNFGKKLSLKHLIKNVIGICIYQGAPKLFRLILSDVVPVDKQIEKMMTESEIPMYVPVDFRANVAKTQRDERFMTLNQSKGTNFVSVERSIDIENVLNSDLLDSFRVRPEEVEAYHDAHATQAMRFVMTEGIAVLIDLESEIGVTGDGIMVIDSEDGEFDFTGVRCWVPESLKNMVDFDEGSKVVVMGQTAKGTFGDEMVPMINVSGIYARREGKIPLVPEGEA